MGYSPLLSGNNNPSNAGDLQEGFELGWELEEDTQDNTKNLWPDATVLPDFRVAVLQY